MLKALLIIISFVMVGITSGHTVKLNKEDIEAIETLQKAHGQLQTLQTVVNTCLGAQKPKVCAISKYSHRLRELEEARTEPDNWPGNSFSDGFTYDISLLQRFNTALVRIAKSILECNNDIVAKQTQKGVGLIIQDPEQTENFMELLGSMQRGVLPLLISIQNIGSLYFEQLFVVHTLLQGIPDKTARHVFRINDFQAPNLQSWIDMKVNEKEFSCKRQLKAATGIVHENYVRFMLFAEAANHVFCLGLNVWHNLNWAHALNFQALGDSTLVDRFPDLKAE